MRALTLWRIWEASDMAQSDSYFATKREALAELRNWGAKPSALRPDEIDPDDTWTATADDGSTVYLERIYVTPTRAGIASALQHIPHR